jgi:uncharacterized membrane protein HdeD (DUF308 family)
MNPIAEAVSNRASGWSILWAVLSIVAGLFALALPLEASFGAVLVIGWVLIFSSTFQLLHAFQSKGIGHIVWKLLIALLYLGVGIYFLTHPLLGIATLTLAIAIFFLAEGVADVVIYFKVRGSSGSGWILLDGIVTLILGLMIWRHWPSSALWAIGTLLGISMLMTGMSRLMITLAARRLRAVSGAGSPDQTKES